MHHHIRAFSLNSSRGINNGTRFNTHIQLKKCIRIYYYWHFTQLCTFKRIIVETVAMNLCVN